MAKKAYSHKDLEVYQRGFEAATAVFDLSKGFPKEERYSLTDQIRKSARSVCANLAEAWWKRRYEPAFVNKLTDVQAEAAETQVWLQFSVRCGYLEVGAARELYRAYDGVLRTVVGMINHADTWILPPKGK